MSENIVKDKYGIYEFSVKHLFTNEDSKYGGYASLSVALSSALLFIFPIVFVIGYMMDIRESAVNGEKVPKFEYYKVLGYEGIQALIAYSPLLFIIFVGIVMGLMIPPFFSIIGLALFLFPAVSIKYAIERDYKKVYSSELIELVFNDDYIKYFIIYIIFTTFLLGTLIIFGTLTLGLGFILLLPIFVSFRAAYWGYAYDNIEIE